MTNPLADFDAYVEKRGWGAATTDKGGLYDFALPTRPCPSKPVHSAIVPVTLKSLPCHAFPICLCERCRVKIQLDASPHLPELTRFLGRDFALWALAWCISPRKSKRFVEAELERVCAVQSVARLSANPEAARHAVMTLLGDQPWE